MIKYSDIIRQYNSQFNCLNEELLTENNRTDLYDWAGKDLGDRFRKLRKQFKQPKYRDQYYWIKNNKNDPDQLEMELDALEGNPDSRAAYERQADQGTIELYREVNENGVPNGWRILRIENAEAASKYGRLTHWCITGTKEYENGRTGADYFNEYHDVGARIYYYIHEPSQRKFALVVGPSGGFCEIYTYDDKRIARPNFFPSNNDIDKFCPRVNQDGSYSEERANANRELKILNSLPVITVTVLFKNKTWTIERPNSQVIDVGHGHRVNVHNQCFCTRNDNTMIQYVYDIRFKMYQRGDQGMAARFMSQDEVRRIPGEERQNTELVNIINDLDLSLNN